MYPSTNNGMQVPFLQPGMMPIMVPPPSFLKPRMSGYDKLTTIPGVFIKQKFNVAQAFTGCEMTHRHFVYALGPDGKAKKGNKIFKCKEISSFWMRQCCSAHARAFSMDVTHKDYQDTNFDGQPFLRFERPFKCSCLCLDRPVLSVTHNEAGQNSVIGKIINPYQCCDLKVNIYDANDNLKYTIAGSCCQAGVLCGGPCCQEAEFQIYSGDQIVGNLKRVPADFLKSVVESLANFNLTFPVNATGPERALLIAATIMMDFTYFDRKPNQNNNGSTLNGTTINF